MATRAKDPAIVAEGQKVFRITGKVLTLVAIALAIVCIVVKGISNFRDYRTESAKVSSQRAARTEIPLASSPQLSWAKAVMPAGIGNKSDFIPLPRGMHHIETQGVGSNKFLLHNVYAGGSTCAFGNSCPDGDVTGYYFTNESNQEKTVLFAFVPK